MERTISEMEKFLEREQRDIEDNRKKKATLLEEIKAFRADINEALDRLEEASVAEVEEKFGKLDQEFREELKNIQGTLDRLAACNAEMETSQRNSSQQFVNMKMSENLISKAQIHVIGTRTRDALEDNLTFDRNSEISDLLQNLGSLAKTPLPTKHGLYEVQSKKSYNIKLNDDVNDYNIRSACILDTDDIMFADYNNKDIKMVDSETYKVQQSMKMSARPSSVCKMSNVEVAVTCDNKSVQFVSTRNQLVSTHSATFDHDCRGIAIMDGLLVICENGKKAYIYTLNGERMKTIDKDQSGSEIFSHIREIRTSDDGKMVHMVDSNIGLITIDRDGNVVWKYSGQVLNSAWGVCTDGNGNVFVSGESSKNVVQLGPDGKLLGEVVSKAHGLHWPRAVSFDKKGCKLIVSDGNELHVFHVQ